MEYAKPEVTPIGNANALIQDQAPGSKLGAVSDNEQDITAAAYEADE